ncbi:hypothetical protein K3727_17025 [Rhodobacteraceae bacterium M382]|nr:hypothetical protein K3727_17025 [Rhodobacteraceae bacterium M382]
MFVASAHAFCDITATSIAELHPEHIGIIRDILGHVTLDIAEKHYEAKANSERKLSKVANQIDKIVDASAQGKSHPSMKDKMDTLEDRKAEVENDLENTETQSPVWLHQGLADMCLRRHRLE